MFTASLGYAVPGTVLAIALLLLLAPLGFPPLLLLIFGYGNRFIAVAAGLMPAWSAWPLASMKRPPALAKAGSVLRRAPAPAAQPAAAGGAAGVCRHGEGATAHLCLAPL